MKISNNYEGAVSSRTTEIERCYFKAKLQFYQDHECYKPKGRWIESR
jgi:hypothetical protein